MREGIAIHPCGWLTLANDSVNESYRFRDNKFLGLLHQGDSVRATVHRGGELALGNGIKLRWGNSDGKPTSGLALAIGTLWLNYAEAQGLLPDIVGSGESFKDVHIYGFDWSLD